MKKLLIQFQRNHFQLIREALRHMLLCAIEIQFMANSRNHREIIKREKLANINIRAHRFPQLLFAHIRSGNFQYYFQFKPFAHVCCSSNWRWQMYTEILLAFTVGNIFPNITKVPICSELSHGNPSKEMEK